MFDKLEDLLIRYDEIYLELNNNAASGLFAPGFFESDMDKSLRQLQNVKL